MYSLHSWLPKVVHYLHYLTTNLGRYTLDPFPTIQPSIHPSIHPSLVVAARYLIIPTSPEHPFFPFFPYAVHYVHVHLLAS